MLQMRLPPLAVQILGVLIQALPWNPRGLSAEELMIRCDEDFPATIREHAWWLIGAGIVAEHDGLYGLKRGYIFFATPDARQARLERRKRAREMLATAQERLNA